MKQSTKIHIIKILNFSCFEFNFSYFPKIPISQDDKIYKLFHEQFISLQQKLFHGRGETLKNHFPRFFCRHCTFSI